MMRLVARASRPRTLACLGAAVVAGATLSACSVGSARRSGAAVLRVSDGDLHISTPKRVTAGDFLVTVHNRGPDNHELILVRTATGRLPMRSDGLTVDEAAVERNEAGALEPGEPGSVRELEVHLTRGRYVLLCNMSGHYLGGMRAVLVVQ